MNQFFYPKQDMNYPQLQEGDYLPTVGILQKLLNSWGASLVVDGHFGPKTKDALCKFQLKNNIWNKPGEMDAITWALLRENINFPIIDCIDVAGKKRLQIHHEVYDFDKLGGKHIDMGAMSNGIEQAIQNILVAVPSKDCGLVRFHGYGRRSGGGIAISVGKPASREETLSGINNYAIIDWEDGDYFATASKLAPLRSIFGTYGSAEFHHCLVASSVGGKISLISYPVYGKYLLLQLQKYNILEEIGAIDWKVKLTLPPLMANH